MIARRRRHRPARAQAIVELSLSLPVMVMLALGASDLGRAFFYQLPVSTAASAGARAGVVSSTADIGNAIRTQSSAMPNNAATWGCVETTTGCGGTTATPSGGDSAGCASNSAFWTNPPTGAADPVACFAMRSCTLNVTSGSHDGQCSTPGVCLSATSSWQIRPLQGSAQANPPCLGALQVTVVYRLVPVTPLIGQFFSGPGNALFLTSTATVMEEY